MSAQPNLTHRPAAGSPLPAPQQPQPGPVPVEEPAPPPKKGPGGWSALLLLLLGAGAGWWLYNASEGAGDLAASTAGGGPGAAILRTAKVTTGNLESTIRLSGTIAARSFAAIRAPRIRTGSRALGGGGAAGLAGGGGGGRGGGGGGGGLTIIEMAEPGTTVGRGQVVAEFDRQTQQQAIDDQEAMVVQAGAIIESTRAKLMIEMETKRQEMVTAKAEFEKAKMDLRTAEVRSEIEAEILKNLMQQTEATYRQLEQEVNLLESAHAAAIRQAEIDKQQEEIDLRRAKLNADYLVVKTPITGVVVMQTIFRGGTFSQVALGDEVFPGAYFMQVVDPSSMVLAAKVNQADTQRIRVGAPAEVRLDAYPDKVWPGRIGSIAAMTGGDGGGRSRTGAGNYVREITVTVEILERSELIIPDLSASADVRVGAVEDAVIAPREALEREGEDWFAHVRVGGDEEFERRQIEVDALTDTHVAVAEGLREGETVALERPRPKQ